jgi:indole-3-glycerol phosphate synthase
MTVKNILDEIVEYKKEELAYQQKERPLSELKESIADLEPPRNIIRKFQEAIVTGKLALIAEVKKASPSKGIIRKDFNPIKIALAYEQAGAAAISVLTDEKFFQGSLHYLNQIKSVVKLPILRKDFIIDPYQVYQARYYGADFILLIHSILSPEKFNFLENLAHSLGMEVLVETHTEEEFAYHLKRKTKIIGINNRDLRTFQTDINHTLNLIKDKEVCKSFIISESGINSFEDILKLSNSNITGVLVGESLMRNDDIITAVKDLMH